MAQTIDSLLSELKNRKIKKTTIESIESLDRKAFFDENLGDSVYEPIPHPLGFGAESDDLYTLAKMIDLLTPRKKWRILEIGTGSGYSTALLSRRVKEIVTIEYHEELALKAKKRLTGMGLKNIRFFAGDATEYTEDLGEFDGVIIFSACMVSPIRFLDTLKENGRAIFPKGPAMQQQICSFTALPDSLHSMNNFQFHDFCRFNSIRGPYGWIDQIQGYITDEAKV